MYITEGSSLENTEMQWKQDKYVEPDCNMLSRYFLLSFIVEAYKVGQAWFPLGESIQTAPDDFCVAHMPVNGFQD